ncbi:MAG: winged helix-turn-helix domain-containing protein [Gemmatimonadaceae bacterium]|nr:winged helix-turn-helix domain-containing protein [Gemmatimonadaceae bacterium]
MSFCGFFASCAAVDTASNPMKAKKITPAPRRVGAPRRRRGQSPVGAHHRAHPRHARQGDDAVRDPPLPRDPRPSVVRRPVPGSAPRRGPARRRDALRLPPRFPRPLLRRRGRRAPSLLRRRGQVATRDELLQDVWRYASEVISRTVDTHIAELRRTLEKNPAEPEHILTIRKAGYRMQM